MTDVWLPGAYHDPGRNAGYNSGRSDMRTAVAHYTVGADSRNVGRDGYFHFLVHKDASRENGCTQYAELDAITWHAADANPWGPGIEWERNTTGGINDEGLSNAEELTDNQMAWGTRIVAFCAEWGIPAQLYDGPRYGAAGWFGWANHQAIDSARSDGLLTWEFDLMTGGAADAPAADYDGSSEDEMLLVTFERDGMFCKSGHLYLLDSLGCVDIDPEPASSFNRTPQGIVSTGTLDGLIGDRLNRAIALGLIPTG